MPQKCNLLSSLPLGEGEDAAKKYPRGGQLRQAHGGRILLWPFGRVIQTGKIGFLSKRRRLNLKNMP